MASSSPQVNLTRAKVLGKYSNLTEFTSGNKRPQEKCRVLAAEDVDIIGKCGGCGKFMSEVKMTFVCSCKWVIHCSKDCFKASKHKCEEPFIRENLTNKQTNKQTNEVLDACVQHYFNDSEANKGPSSEKITRFLNTTKGGHDRILKFAERGIPIAAYVIGCAYMKREFKRGARFAIPLKCKEQSVAETNEIAIKWLKVAGEGEVPEAMFCLFMVMMKEGALNVERRVAQYWLDKAYATGSMDHLFQLLQSPMEINFPYSFSVLFHNITKDNTVHISNSLANLLMATRFRELKAWDGKTAMEKPFYGFPIFKSVMEFIGELKNEQLGPSFIDGEKKTILFISARPGSSDIADKCRSYEREENNLKFLQGKKEKVSPDYQLVGQTSNIDGRTNYLIACKHNQVKVDEDAESTSYSKFRGVEQIVGVKNKSLLDALVDVSKDYKHAGECEPCVKEAKQRLRAVGLGLFSISITPVFEDHVYAARYANEDGVIVQDVFTGYCKPDMRQMLQCLMSNPADLHPLAVAENTNLFWPIIWFWGSVYEAVQDSCDKSTLDLIYSSLGGKIAFAKSENASALAAFPETAAGEWRIACGNENCVKVDHEVKFHRCAGCKVRRYCDPACQRKDREKHIHFCKGVKKQEK